MKIELWKEEDMSHILFVLAQHFHFLSAEQTKHQRHQTEQNKQNWWKTWLSANLFSIKMGQLLGVYSLALRLWDARLMCDNRTNIE